MDHSLELRLIMKDAIKIALSEFATEHGLIESWISERKAFKKYSPKIIKDLNQKGLLTIRRTGDGTNSKKLYSVAEIELHTNKVDKNKRKNRRIN